MKWRIDYDARFAPKGRRLIASLLQSAYTLWVGDNDFTFWERTTLRSGINREFLNVVEPSRIPGTELTAVRLGVAYIWILVGVLRDQQPWPGFINAHLYETFDGAPGIPLGSLVIINSPLMGAKGQKPPGLDGTIASMARQNETVGISFPSSGNGTDTHGSALRKKLDIPERVWLDLVSQMMIYAFSHPRADRLADEFLPGLPPTWFCKDDPTYQAVLLISHAARVLSDNPLTWNQLAQALLDWTYQMAEQEQWRSVDATQIQRHDGVVLAHVVMRRVQPHNNGEAAAQDSAATA